MNTILKEFDKCKNDIEKWKWVKDNQHLNIIIICDNDSTFLIVEDTEDEYSNFDNWIGCSAGIFDLLESLSIRADGV